MKDIFDSTMLCDQCNGKTEKTQVSKDGFVLRAWKCNKCNKLWFHPLDLRDYQDYIELRKKDFQVKLREVGNSWIVSIPKEIIRFEEISTAKVISLNLDEPGKVVLKFTRVRRYL